MFEYWQQQTNLLLMQLPVNSKVVDLTNAHKKQSMGEGVMCVCMYVGIDMHELQSMCSGQREGLWYCLLPYLIHSLYCCSLMLFPSSQICGYLVLLSASHLQVKATPRFQTHVLSWQFVMCTLRIELKSSNLFDKWVTHWVLPPAQERVLKTL